MQNVVDVACSSPPVAMNATKPTAQAVKAADQDPFGMVLQKASECIDTNKIYDGARQSSESKSIENRHGSDSTDNKKVTEGNKEREVIHSSKAEKADKPEKVEKDQMNQDNDKPIEKESEPDPSTMVFGYVAPVNNAADNIETVNLENVEATGDGLTAAVQPVNVSQIASTTATQTEESVTDLSAQTTPVAAVNGNEEDQEQKVEAEPSMTFAESLSKSDKSGEKAASVIKPADDNPNAKLVDGEKIDTSTNTSNHGQEVSAVAQKYQEAVASTEVSVAKTNKPANLEASTENAPPDTPNGTTGVTANSTVQTASQISEPARLAEAPKNEVITQVANEVDQMVKTNRSSLRVQLYPEELGHIDLRIVTTKDGIGVTMVTEKVSTQQVLKSEMDLLKLSIEQAGISTLR